MASSKAKKKGSSAGKPKSGPSQAGGAGRWVLVGVLIVVALYGAYRVLSPSTRGASAPAVSSQPAAQTTPLPPEGVTGPVSPGTAQVVNGVQKISIDVSNVYNPNVVNLKAGMPAELTFSGGQGCTSVVHSEQLGFSEDMSAGPRTVELKALQPGTYQFSCGMDMVFGKVVVR